VLARSWIRRLVVDAHLVRAPGDPHQFKLHDKEAAISHQGIRAVDSDKNAEGFGVDDGPASRDDVSTKLSRFFNVRARPTVFTVEVRCVGVIA
jgi:hypothetical protein